MPGKSLNHFYFYDGPVMASADAPQIDVIGKGGRDSAGNGRRCHRGRPLYRNGITNHRFPQRVSAQCGSVTIGTLQAADAANIINEKR